jgi:pyruvate/2-oxoglutarate dehydrogenase complex dihydrolipoamide dehydrogenase (E3) component
MSMKQDHADVAVVGLGPGGEEIAVRLAKAGLDVVGIEGGLVGGECPYWGCVPSKMMIRAANLLAEGRRIPGVAGSSTVTPNWAPLARRIREEATDDWNDQVAVDRLKKGGVRFVRAWGRLDGPGHVVVDDTRYRIERAIVVAAGAKPAIPAVEGLIDAPFWSNRQAIETERVPSTMIVMGGGAIGLELGQVFARFGADVTILEAASRLLAAEEPESSKLITAALKAEGVKVFTEAAVASVAHDGSSFSLRFNEKGVGGLTTVSGEALLVATGRHPDLGSFGTETIGVDPSGPGLKVNGRMQVVPGVWAVGDVTGVGPFTHVAMYQARIAADDILGVATDEADYHALPRVTFTDPEVGSVGLSEASALEAGIRVRVGRAPIAESARGWIHKVGNEGFIKVIEDADRGVLVGATSAGPVGGEVLGLLTLAVHAQVPTSRLRSMIYAYPTFHRAVESALADLQV